MITDEKSDPPIIPGNYERDEDEQVRHLHDMLAVYEAESIDSAFWFTFAGFEQPRHPTDPHRDLDLASYGVVAVLKHERGTTYPDMAWQPKQVCTFGGMNLDDLPAAEFAFPGPLRDQLVAAILSGAKTSTSSLMLGYERENEPLPEVGQLSAVLNSAGQRVAVIEVTEVQVVRLADVDLQHALDEGEGYESVEQWRSGHEGFWHSAEVRAEMGDPNFTVNDDTLVMAERFRLVNVAD